MSDATETIEAEADVQTPDAGLLTGEDKTDAVEDRGLLTSDDDKDANTKTDEGEGQKDGDEEGDDKREGAPESYEDFTAPEGVELDADLVEEFKGFAKEANLPQAEAQKFVDLGAKLVDKWVDGFAENIIAQRQGWLETSRAEFDQPTLSTARKGLETFGTPELTQFLRDEGIENHPEVIRLLSKVGGLASEDGFVAGGKAPEGEKPLANRMFPTAN